MNRPPFNATATETNLTNMSITVISSLIILVILTALIVSSISYHRQKTIAQQRKDIARLKKTAAELIPYRDFIAMADPEYELLCLLQKQIVVALAGVLEIVPSDEEIRAQVASENKTLKQYLEGIRQGAINQIMTSEDELKVAKQTLARLSKHLDISRNAGTLSAAQHQRLLRRTQALSALIEVASHEHQAQQCADKGDIVLYQTHLKQARDALKKSPVEDEEKNARIKALTETLNEVKRTNQIVALPAGAENKSGANNSAEAIEEIPPQNEAQ